MFGATEDEIHSAKEPSIQKLNAMIPRKVRLDADVGYKFLLFVIVFLGGGLICIGGASYYYAEQAWHREALNRGGREAIARITEIDSGRGSTAVYYTFRLSGTVHQGHAYFPQDRYLNIRVGEEMPILFLPSDPSINHPISWEWWSWWDLVPQLFLLFFSCVGAVPAGALYRDRRLARVGWVTEATVIACAPNGKQFRVDYEFYSEDHEQFDGANENCDEYKTGSKIRVIYLRKNPKRNDTYPMSTYRTVE